MQENSRTPDEQEVCWTSISNLTVDSRSVNVIFRVLEKEDSRKVTARSSGRSHQVTNCIVGDATAIVTMTLWNFDVDEIKIGESYELINGYINVHDECMHLGRSRWGVIRSVSSENIEINRALDMSRPFMGRPKRKRRARSLTGRTFSGTAGRESRGYPSRKGF